MEKLAGLCFITSKYKSVKKSAQPKDPPGCPEFTPATILTMSLLTCDAIRNNCVVSMYADLIQKSVTKLSLIINFVSCIKISLSPNATIF